LTETIEPSFIAVWGTKTLDCKIHTSCEALNDGTILNLFSPFRDKEVQDASVFYTNRLKICNLDVNFKGYNINKRCTFKSLSY